MTKVPRDARILNAEQQEAVTFGDGPLLIIAGAGTGKTTVVTERIKHLISSGKAKPSEILALTFTEKAAREMEERVDVIMPYGYTQMWISTFHKFCDRILRQEAIHIGLNPAYRLMTDTDATMLFRKNLFHFELDYFRPLGNPTKFIAGMLQHFSRLQDEDVNPTQYLDWVNSKHEIRKSKQIQNSKSEILNDEEELEYKKYLELARAYKAYQDLKVKEGVMDFGDLITQTLALFRKRKNMLAFYQKQFTYILVDEFQDTNIAQNELVVLLAGKLQNVTAVCDDDQSIYKFRGAAVSNVLSFRKHFPKSKLIVLSQNYRSTQAILDASYQLIQHNNPDRLEVKEHINKKLTAAGKKSGQWPTLIYVDRVENEADEVAKIIRELGMGDRGQKPKYQWKDFAILVRANNHAEPFSRALARHDIPFQFLGPGQLFRQPEVKDLIAYLQVLQNFEDSVAMFRVLSMEYFGFTGRDIAVLSNYARKQNVSLFEACEASGDERIKTIITMIHRHLGLVSKESAGQILYYFLSDTGMMKNILDYSAPIDERKANNISNFFSKLKTYETDHADASVTAILDWIELSMELGESPIAGDTDWVANNAVNILSVHSSKGLEFPVVFLVNMVSARFPTIERREQIPIPDALIKEELPEGDYHLEEERRLCYVGMTRAKDHLYFTGANFYGEGKREKKLSPFVYEVMGENALMTQKPVSTQLALMDWAPHNPERSRGIPIEHTARPVVTYLSYSQIDTFRLCPLHYKLRYIVNIPTPPSASLSFGTSVHDALHDFYELFSSGEKVTKELLLTLLKNRWRREGYENREYEEKMKKRGEQYLSDFFEKEFDPKTRVAALEQPFTVPIAHEGKAIKIGGRIDRVDIQPSGNIEIIDYKTGRMPSKREVDTNLQLSMYALAASEIPTAPFGKKPGEIILSLYFFDTQTKMSTTRTQDQLAKEKATIIDIARQIEQSDFRCSGNQLCTDCEYRLFCGVS
ncbi:MAG TPA: ATP-dependent DNA helicase [Patescibacteria group bacterium]|nr:ATP-dependent DNA helicase [Patescibacteria group bacterium]